MSLWNRILCAVKKSRSFLTHRTFLFLLPILVSNLLSILHNWTPLGANTLGLLIFSHGISFCCALLLMRTLFKHYKDNKHMGTEMKPLDPKDKYGKTGLSKSFSLELKNRLEYLMANQKLYLQHQLKLDDIAELLDISRHHASQVINENFQVSFYDYINAFRIEDAKRQLVSDYDPSKSISDLAYECGFNNRVSFYKAFKKLTATTPTEYLAKKAA